MDSDARLKLFRRCGWARTVNGPTHGRHHADGDAGFLARREKHITLFLTDAVLASRPVRHVHGSELFPLVHFLGAEFDPGLLPRASLGWTGTRSCRHAVL